MLYYSGGIVYILSLELFQGHSSVYFPNTVCMYHSLLLINSSMHFENIVCRYSIASF